MNNTHGIKKQTEYSVKTYAACDIEAKSASTHK